MDNFNTADVDEIISFYSSEHFDRERLILLRDMLLDCIVEDGISSKNLNDIVNFLRKRLELAAIVSEIFRLITIMLTIPVTSVTCKRSFSAMRRIKTYLRNSLSAEGLNYVSVLNIHQYVDINLDPLIEELISREPKRVSTYGIPKSKNPYKIC
ncbi:hypothetical protein PGB90_006579 [Kerria lacca]